MPVYHTGPWRSSQTALVTKVLLLVSACVYVRLAAGAIAGESASPAIASGASSANANNELTSPTTEADLVASRAASPDAPDIEWEVTSLKTAWHAEADGDQNARVSMSEYSFALALPILRSERHTVLLHSSVGIVDLGVDIHGMPKFDTELESIDRLYEAEMGVQYLHQLNNGWHIGTGLRVTTRGNDPFASDDEVFLHPNLELTIPHMERNAWLIGIGYESDQEQVFPIAGYKLRWAERNLALLGFPGGFYHQRIGDNMAVDAKYLFPYDGELKVTYEIPGSAFSAYTAVSSKTHRWAIANRDDDDQRLFYWDKRIEVGVAYEPREHFELKMLVGRTFDRQLSEGVEIDEDDRLLKIDNGVLAGIQFSISF